MPDFLPDAGEAGTHNVAGICGLGAGIKYILEKRPESILRHEQRVMASLLRQLCDMERICCYCANQSVQTAVLSIAVEDMDCEEVAAFLSEHNIAVRAGLHCAPLAHESAGTLEIGTVRISLSAFNREEEMTQIAKTLHKMVNK